MTKFEHEHTSFCNDPESSVSMVLHNDASLNDVVQEFRKFLLAVGFHPSSVDNYIEAE